jgi:peptide/nickel transport system substrate-binding protein
MIVNVQGAWAVDLRFSPGNSAPVAYDPEVGAYREGASFDPYRCADEPCIELLHNIFEPLVSLAENGRIIPKLAVAWRQLDRRTYRFDLRRNVVFHNGEIFDAEAVRFSLLRAVDAFGDTAWFPRVAEVKVVDPHTIDVLLDVPDSIFLYRLASIGLILPPKHFSVVGQDAFGREPIGTGPFKFVRWDSTARQVHLIANKQYWRIGFPNINKLIYAYMPVESAFDQLVKGEIDLIRRLNPRRARRFMESGAGKIIKEWLPQIVVGSFNLLRTGSPLRDKRVRRAVNLSIDREHMVRYGALGNGRLLGGYALPGDPLDAGLDVYRYSPAVAQALLKEAGYDNGLELTMLVDPQVPPQIENIIAVSLARVGVTLLVTRVSESKYLLDLFLPKFSGGAPPSFDILLLSMPVGGLGHVANVPMTLLYSKEPNSSTIRDIWLDQLYEEALAAPNALDDQWREIERYVREQDLLLFGYQERAVFGAKSNLVFKPRTLLTFWDANLQPDGSREGR